jgi:4-hydroxy-2-oxoheptanedioate aldolase
MTGSAKPDFRALLSERKPLFNAWLGLGLPLSVEIVADAGWDAVMIDQQHGDGSSTALVGCLTAAKAAGVPALVRVAQLDFGLIGRALDAGAQGVVAPMVETSEDATRLVQATKYPPLGGRSFGPNRARFMVEGDYLRVANAWTIACAQIETLRAVDNIDAICSVQGLDMICVGPNDLAISISCGQSRDIRSPEVLDAIEHIRMCAAAKSITTAIFANDREFADRMALTGWQIISIGTDKGWLASMARQQLQRQDGNAEQAGEK